MVRSERSAATSPAAGTPPAALDSAPLLADLMPWSVPAPRAGREWVSAADPDILRARWERLATAGPDERATLFRPSRSRTLNSAVTQLPGQTTSTTRLAREVGACPEPVRARHGAFDRQWLLPDQRLLDSARPELWRVADDAQLFAVVQPPPQPNDPEPNTFGPALSFSAELPDGHRARARARGAGRVLPAYRLPRGRQPNLAPGLAKQLARRLGVPVTAEDVLAWTAAILAHPAAARRGEPLHVPLTASAELWADGVALGRRVLWLHTFGARFADTAEDRPEGRPRMPGGRRPFVRQAVPTTRDGFPEYRGMAYDPEKESLLLGDGRIAPVPRAAWEYRVGGAPVLAEWFARRSPEPGTETPGSLEAIRPATWPRQWTTELIELVTVLALLAELHPAQAKLTEETFAGPLVTAADLRRAGILPVPAASTRPASVLTHQEEGPDGQFPLF